MNIMAHGHHTAHHHQTLGAKVLAFARANFRKKVGDGECFALAERIADTIPQ
jgi:hypothetical protein